MNRPSAHIFGLRGFRRLLDLPPQILMINPFGGNYRPTRVPLVAFSRPSLPFPHPWNFRRPIEILESYFWQVDHKSGAAGKHNRYFELPGFRPVLVSRDPDVIRAILVATGEKDTHFDRDPMPSTGIARATGPNTLLFSNGSLWRRQRKVAAPPFGKTALFRLEVFSEFEETARETVRRRLAVLHEYLARTGARSVRIPLEPEIKAVMLELLVKCFFGATVDYDELRQRYMPAIERCIDHIVLDTVVNLPGFPYNLLGRFVDRYATAVQDHAIFDELTDRVLNARHTGRGLWSRLKEEVPPDALRSNVKVFLAGALEATTSFASWALSHLSRNSTWQEKVYEEVRAIATYTPEHLAAAANLSAALDETLRLTPALYFLPRRTKTRTRVDLEEGRYLVIPADTHILLDVWHANRNEEYWGEAVTGFPAVEFAPERWHRMEANGPVARDRLHFGFGYGPRACPGRHLGLVEVALVVGIFVKLFRFRPVHPDYAVRAGVSTKPADGTLVDMELREPSAGMTAR